MSGNGKWRSPEENKPADQPVIVFSCRRAAWKSFLLVAAALPCFPLPGTAGSRFGFEPYGKNILHSSSSIKGLFIKPQGLICWFPTGMKQADGYLRFISDTSPTLMPMEYFGLNKAFAFCSTFLLCRKNTFSMDYKPRIHYT